MNKQKLIEEIRRINRSATPEFLDTFSEEDLRSYLDYLVESDAKGLELGGD
jgi:hypothetical protein